jgi:hypothetical protein
MPSDPVRDRARHDLPDLKLLRPSAAVGESTSLEIAVDMGKEMTRLALFAPRMAALQVLSGIKHTPFMPDWLEARNCAGARSSSAGMTFSSRSARSPLLALGIQIRSGRGATSGSGPPPRWHPGLRRSHYRSAAAPPPRREILAG